MIPDKLVPDIGQRISAWIDFQDHLKKISRPEQKPTITISRQYGCEGYPLAEALKTLLEKKTGDTWTIFDKFLIEKISQEKHLSERLLTTFGDASKAFDVLVSMIPGMRTHTDTYQILANYIIRIALDGNAIIVGRGGAILTQHLPRCFHFRLEAPLEYRIRSIQQRLKISHEKAETEVKENQHVREKFIEHFLNHSISDPLYYNAIFNNSKNPIPKIARSILCLAFED
jgi:cytidylate kinase